MESLIIYKKIAEKIEAYDGFLAHGVLADAHGIGCLFLGKSGVGKTTHALLWKTLLKENFHIINGDKPLIRCIDGKFYGYGTPWAGKENIHQNKKIAIENLCFIQRATENSCAFLSKEEALKQMYVRTYFPRDPEKRMAVIEKLDCFISNVNCYLISCTPQIEAARIAYAYIMGEKDERAGV